VCKADPTFADLVLANFHRRCVYTEPRYLGRKAYASDKEYMTAYGFGESSDSKTGFEEEDAYFERMSGYINLFAAFVQIPLADHPHGLNEAWKWLARVLNQKPRTATASVLGAFLEQAGYQLLQSFPRQMRKVLVFIERDFLGRCLENTPARKAAKKRLEVFLVMYHKRGDQLEEPEGKTLAHTQESHAGVESIQRGD
jgi:nucleoporin GLE1